MGGEVRELRIPRTRGLDPELRRKRLLAARHYPPGAIPRFAILMGHWDGGLIVASAGQFLEGKKDARAPKRRSRRNRRKDHGQAASSR